MLYTLNTHTYDYERNFENDLQQLRCFIYMIEEDTTLVYHSLLDCIAFHQTDANFQDIFIYICKKSGTTLRSKITNHGC